MLTGKWDSKDAAFLTVQICKSSPQCVEMRYKGSFFTEDYYEYIFEVSRKAVRNSEFSAVKLSAAHPLKIFNVAWKNYQK